MNRQLTFLLVFTLFLAMKNFGQAPVMGPIQGPAAVCSPPAQPKTFTATASNSPTSYSWSTSPSASVVIVNSSSPFATISFPNTNSTYTVYCSATNGSGTSNTASFVVTVYETPTVTFSGATIFCQGSGTNLSASPTIISASSTLTYSWSPSIGLSSTTLPNVNANPPSTTTYTVLLTIGACTNNAQVTVTVIGNPTISATANPPNVCSGKPSTISINGSGVTYSVYSTQVGTSATVNPVVSTNYIVSTTGTNGCTAYTQVPVNVLAGPTISWGANPSAICQGVTSTISVTGNALSYSLNGTFMSSPIATVAPLVSTTYSVSGTASNGCTTSVNAGIFVIPSPSIAAVLTPSNICNGQSATLYISGSGLTYSLNGNSVGTFTSVNPAVTTTYVIASTGTGGCTNTATVLLPVTPNPTISVTSSPSVTCKGEITTVSVGGNVSTFTVNAAASPATFTASPAVTQTYIVTGAGANNCTSQSSYVHKVNPCTGIDREVTSSDSPVNVFPNPNNGTFQIQTDIDTDAVLYDQLGQVIFSMKLLHNSENRITGLAPGIYFMKTTHSQSRIIVAD